MGCLLVLLREPNHYKIQHFTQRQKGNEETGIAEKEWRKIKRCIN
jgi:hypothetical protein